MRCRCRSPTPTPAPPPSARCSTNPASLPRRGGALGGDGTVRRRSRGHRSGVAVAGELVRPRATWHVQLSLAPGRRHRLGAPDAVAVRADRDQCPGFWIVPSWSRAFPPRRRATIRLDPGMAFGTGTHPTTRMCLCWIAAHAASGSAPPRSACSTTAAARACSPSPCRPARRRWRSMRSTSTPRPSPRRARMRSANGVDVQRRADASWRNGTLRSRHCQHPRHAAQAARAGALVLSTLDEWRDACCSRAFSSARPPSCRPRTRRGSRLDVAAVRRRLDPDEREREAHADQRGMISR